SGHAISVAKFMSDFGLFWQSRDRGALSFDHRPHRRARWNSVLGVATIQQARVLLAEAGEHLVVSRLLGLGYVAGQLPRTYRADDVYVECVNQQIVHFQVKTTQLERNGWPVSRIEDDPTRFFAFVNLFQRLAPVVYVIPSATVRDA